MQYTPPVLGTIDGQWPPASNHYQQYRLSSMDRNAGTSENQGYQQQLHTTMQQYAPMQYRQQPQRLQQGLKAGALRPVQQQYYAAGAANIASNNLKLHQNAFLNQHQRAPSFSSGYTPYAAAPRFSGGSTMTGLLSPSLRQQGASLHGNVPAKKEKRKTRSPSSYNLWMR